MNGLAINLHIDGTDPADNFTLGGGFDNAPFYVFDADTQQNAAGPYDTRHEAAYALAAVSIGRIRTFMTAAKV